MEFWVSKLLSCLFRFNCLNSKVVVFLAMSRGFPVWLKYVPGISFRTDNEPFKVSFELLLFIRKFKKLVMLNVLGGNVAESYARIH